MARISTIIIVVILSAATAEAQNYPPFLREAEQVLANEFRELEQQDWQEWREQQEWRFRKAGEGGEWNLSRLPNTTRSYSAFPGETFGISPVRVPAGDGSRL